MKVLALALFVVVALHCATASKLPHTAEKYPIFYRNGQRWDPIGETKAAIASLVETITGAINTAKTEILDALAAVDAFYDQVKTATQTELDRLVDEAIAGLADLVPGVPEEILNACVDESGITTIPVGLMDDLISCVTDKIAEAVGLVNDIIKNINRAINIVSTFDDRLGSCGWSVGCYADLLWDISTAAVEIPINITGDVAKATALVTGLTTDLEICAALQVTEAGILIAKDVAKIVICMENSKIAA